MTPSYLSGQHTSSANLPWCQLSHHRVRETSKPLLSSRLLWGIVWCFLCDYFSLFKLCRVISSYSGVREQKQREKAKVRTGLALQRLRSLGAVYLQKLFCSGPSINYFPAEITAPQKIPLYAEQFPPHWRCKRLSVLGTKHFHTARKHLLLVAALVT